MNAYKLTETNFLPTKNNVMVRAEHFNTLVDDVQTLEDRVDAILPSDGTLEADTINEETSGAGVTVDGVLIKDGKVEVVAGTVASPSIKVGEESGLYLSSAGTLGVSVSGTYVGRFTVDSGLELNNASVAYFRTSSVVVNNDIDPANKATFANDIVAGKIFTGTPVGNINYTLPTGTEMDTANDGAFLSNYGVEFSVINLSANTITFLAGAAFTIVGGAVVLANTSARFKAIRAAANTYVLYRLA